MILYTLLAIWLLKAVLETIIGLGQIVAGAILTAAAAALCALSWFIEILVGLWKTAFSKE